jgi:hypothetical protein
MRSLKSKVDEESSISVFWKLNPPPRTADIKDLPSAFRPQPQTIAKPAEKEAARATS